MSSQLINSSIDLTLLLEMANKAHTSCHRSAKNQHVYVNLSIWINDEPDQYGNHASIQLNSAKDCIEKDKAINPKGKNNCYIGHGKKANLGPQPLQAGDNTGLALNSNLYGQSQPQQNGGNPWDAPKPNDGLPF